MALPAPEPQPDDAGLLDAYSTTVAGAISSRRSGVRRAFLWMFIRTPPAKLKRGNSSLLGRVRMDNLMKAHI